MSCAILRRFVRSTSMKSILPPRCHLSIPRPRPRIRLPLPYRPSGRRLPLNPRLPPINTIDALVIPNPRLPPIDTIDALMLKELFRRIEMLELEKSNESKFMSGLKLCVLLATSGGLLIATIGFVSNSIEIGLGPATEKLLVALSEKECSKLVWIIMW